MRNKKRHSLSWSVLMTMLFWGIPLWSLAATLHVLIVADTNDVKIGTVTDVKEMEPLMNSISENTGLKLNLKIISGNDLTPDRGHDKVTSAVNALRPEKDDVVIFYYTGHGTNLGDNSRWPALAVEGQRSRQDSLIRLQWVVEQLAQQSPRLFIAMADACNKLPRRSEREFVETRADNKEAYRKLFLSYQGSIVASSSKVDQYSYGDPSKGGFFTTQFRVALRDALNSPNPTWEGIMGNDKAIKPIPTGDTDQPMQMPQAQVKVTEVIPPITIQGGGNTTFDDCRARQNCQAAGWGDDEKKDDEKKDGDCKCTAGCSYPKDSKECCIRDNGEEHCYD